MLRRGLIGPMLKRLPKTRWYKSRANQALWLHELSFASGGERYAAGLTFFHFSRRERQLLFTPEALRALEGLDAESVIRVPYERARGASLDKMMYADSKIRLPDHPVVISDRTSMAHGLETRSPYMDHRLAEFAARLPVHLKVSGRGLRVIQRKLAARYLPADVLARPKQGFASALPYLLGAQFLSLFSRVLAGSRLVADGILRRDTIDRLLRADRDRTADHGVRLWLLANAELWYRMKILGVTGDALRRELVEERAA